MMRGLVVLMVVLLTGTAIPASAQVFGERPVDWVPPPPETVPNHREQWREVVIGLASYAKGRKSNFAVLVENGAELVAKGEREVEWEELQDPGGVFFEKRLPEGAIFRPYLTVIDGVVVPGMYCGDNRLGKSLDQAMADWKKREEDSARARARGINLPRVAQDKGPFSSDPATERKRALEVKRAAETQERLRRLLLVINALNRPGQRVLSYDACPTDAAVKDAFEAANRDGVLESASVAPSLADLTIPSGVPWGENSASITSLQRARNWLAPVRPTQFYSKTDWLTAESRNNYDMVVVDLNYGTEGISAADVELLKFKKMGPRRLVLARLPVGKAYDTAWYWKPDWRVDNPAFLFAPDGQQAGVFITDVGNPQWRELLGKTLKGIIDVGFDGVVLTEVDTYLWFEDLMPLSERYE